MDNKRSGYEWALLAAVAGVAAATRVGWVMSGTWTSADGEEYLTLARALATHGVYSYDGITPTSYRPPLYPALLAIAMNVSSRPVQIAMALQVILGTVTVLLTYSLASRLFNKRAATIAAVLLALAPMTSRYAASLLTETVFTFLIVLMMWAWQRDRPVLAGLACGLGILTRAALFPYLALVGALAFHNRQKRRWTTLTIVLIALLTLSPWVIRNLRVAGHLTVAEAGWGTNLLYGTIDLRPGSNPWGQIESATKSLGLRGDHTAEAEQLSRRMAIDRIRAHPWEWAGIRARQYPRLLVDTGDYLPLRANQRTFADAWKNGQFETIALKSGFLVGNAVLFLLAVYGLWIHRQHWGELAPIWSFPAFLLTAQLPMYAEPRYGLPLMPSIVVLAAAAIDVISKGDLTAEWVSRQPATGPTLANVKTSSSVNL